MPRGLDHIVHAVRDLDAAADLYRRLGFTVGARNKHPWGTHNTIVQLPGFFIEVLSFVEPDKLGSDGFSTLFAAYNRDFIARQEGFSLLVLESNDAEADEADFREAGILLSPVMRFEREGKRPDGTAVKVGFSLAFAEDKGARDIHFCVCQQHYPENFWNSAFQRHANGASAVAGVVAVAEEPERHRGFFEAYSGGPAAAVAGGFGITTPRGVIEVLTPAAFLHRFGTKPPDARSGARLAALRVKVPDVDLMQAVPELAGLAGLGEGDSVVVGQEDAMGAILVFEPVGRP
ncbi:MAG: VOC family protein [Pseudolabrys sp.]